MRKVSGSIPHGVQDKKENKSVRSLSNMGEKKRRNRGGREAENGRKEARDVARESAQSNPLLFIQ